MSGADGDGERWRPLSAELAEIFGHGSVARWLVEGVTDDQVLSRIASKAAYWQAILDQARLLDRGERQARRESEATASLRACQRLERLIRG